MTTTAAIYVNAAGYARYWEPKGKPLGPVAETGLTRVPLPAHIEGRPAPYEIQEAETAYRASLTPRP